MLGKFYKINNEVLKFKVVKDIDKIIFNHYLMQKENFQRITGDLPKGQFKICVRTCAADLNITKSKAQRLIKEFVRIKVIEVIRIGRQDRTPSIYSYITSKIETVDETVNNTLVEIVEPRNTSILEDISDTVSDTVNECVGGTSKKENLKSELKKNLNIEEEEEEGVLEYDLRLLYMAYKDAKGAITKAIKIELHKLLKLYSRELIIKAIHAMTLRADNPNLNYVINTLKDWKSRGLVTAKNSDEAILEFDNNKVKKINKSKVVKGNNNYNTKKCAFNDYEQREYDFDELEKKLMGWE